MPSEDALLIAKMFRKGGLSENEAVLRILILAGDHEASPIHEVLPRSLQKRLEAEVADVDPAKARILESVCTGDPVAYAADLKRREALLRIGIARFQDFLKTRTA